jgi:hypothetical protein
MKIRSEDNRALLELTRNDPHDPHSGYIMRMVVQTSEGRFSGENGCVHFSGFREFLSEFADLVTSRHGEATLDLTEDCLVHFFRRNQRGDLGCKATVTKYIFANDALRTTPVSMTAEFGIETEYLNTIQSEFRNMDERR